MSRSAPQIEITDSHRSEMTALTAEIDEQSRVAQILAADAAVARARADAAMIRRTYLVKLIVEGAGFSVSTHGVNVERAEIVELEAKS